MKWCAFGMRNGVQFIVRNDEALEFRVKFWNSE